MNLRLARGCGPWTGLLPGCCLGLGRVSFPPCLPAPCAGSCRRIEEQPGDKTGLGQKQSLLGLTCRAGELPKAVHDARRRDGCRNQNASRKPWSATQHERDWSDELSHHHCARHHRGVRHALHPKLQAKARDVGGSCNRLRQQAGRQDQPPRQQNSIRHARAPSLNRGRRARIIRRTHTPGLGQGSLTPGKPARPFRGRTAPTMRDQCSRRFHGIAVTSTLGQVGSHSFARAQAWPPRPFAALRSKCRDGMAWTTA